MINISQSQNCTMKNYRLSDRNYTYYGLKFYTDSIAQSDGISMSINLYSEK